MIHNFGKFNIELREQENEFGKFTYKFGVSEEDGRIWQEIYSEVAEFDGPNFIKSDYPYFAAVTPNNVVRMVWDNPSMSTPDDGGYMIASDEPIDIGATFNPETNELHETPKPPTIIIVYAVDFWSRLTDEEAEQVVDFIDTQPVRLRRIFNSANSYRSDHELWDLLQGMSVNMFGEERTAEIFAPSETETV